jgi:folate-binding protein YgfZ
MTIQDLELKSWQSVVKNNENLVCDLSHLGLLEISGIDAVNFLQGQVTNDVKLLQGNNAHYSAYCTPKGRALALFFAFAHLEHIHLQFNRELTEPIMKRLKMYVMRSKVDIKDVTDNIAKFGLYGPDADSILATLFAKTPKLDFELITLENVTLVKLPSTDKNQRFEIFVSKAISADLLSKLKSSCKLVGIPCWDWLEVQVGIPDVSLKTQEQFVPQMLNLDILNGINFKKGCYTGQEIIARTHYLGSVKRRTYLASINNTSAPNAGDLVLDDTQAEVGQIVRVAPNLENGFDMLVEIRIEAWQTDKVFWNTTQLNFKPLPYSVNS